jgi:23S rRNA (guanosine2251-2'-O)-methyltransferase
VIRSAVALSDGAVVWGEHSAAPLTAATFRASAGAIEHARLCRVRSLRGAMSTLASHDVQTVALDAHAEVLLSDLDLRRPTALVIGAEDAGVSRGLRQCCRHTARLPMRGRLDSLNASVAAAVALYEAQRQRAAAARTPQEPDAGRR